MSYDPTIGRFISEDPIAFDGGDANLYRYAFNSPVNIIDITGHFGIPILPLDGDGQLQGDVPQRVDPSWDCGQLGQALEDILKSIASREGAMDWEDMFGDGRDPGHIARKNLEEQFKDKIKNRMKQLDCGDGTNAPVPAPKPPGSKPTSTTTTTTTAVPNPNPSAPPPPPGGYPPNPSTSLPWWVPENPGDDWKWNVGTVVVGAPAIGGTIAFAAPGFVGWVGGTVIGWFTGAGAGVAVGAGAL